MSRARPADPAEYARLHNLVEGLCIAGGLPKPRVYIVDDPAPNAFATGRNPNHAAIAVTTGLLDMLNRVELEGVVAHELSHIRNYDILVSTLAVTMVGAVALMTDMAIRMMWWNGGRVARRGDHSDSNNPLAFVGFALLIVAPIVAKAMQATISRRRETLADVSACQLTRYPPGLISALEKLQEDTTVTHSASTATAHLWIEQPMSGVGDGGRLERRPQAVRHASTARRAHRTVEGTLMTHKLVAALAALALTAAACSGGDDDRRLRRRDDRCDDDDHDHDHDDHDDDRAAGDDDHGRRRGRLDPPAADR